MYEMYKPYSTYENPKIINKIRYDSKHGKLIIYKNTYFNLFNSCEYIHIYYNKENQTIAIEPLKNKDEHSIKVYYAGQTAVIRIKRFLTFYNIVLKDDKYIPIIIDEPYIIFNIS